MSQSQFNVDVKGDVTGRQYMGAFTVKTRLSHRDTIREDQVRRDILGPNSDGADPKAKGLATAIASLAVRVVKSPTWWSDSDGGLELEDENILVEVYNKTHQATLDERKELAEQAEKAKEELRAGLGK